ncbi:hypothetical protein RWV98_19180 [Agathobaculum sp. NTUH-O15-33]|uniref:hypothetical protein n=1 Tax=Agathobaculum sp. NTUH-O15-33 TaxID=3079302 RepID=UPI002958A592|nr:hypothetical protein [Agathobaculum sp. NTUH-O15-33]WNX84669.1 hypothetical protein RWV98_19180 [Agathobaculum sp. NTUH-O15-33]
MKKKNKILVVAILVFATAMSYAAANKIVPYWNYVTSVGGSIDISSGGTASVSADGSAATIGVDNVKLYASLQQLKNGSWVTLKTWSTEADARSTRITTKTWPVAHGYSYRLQISLEAYKNVTLLETGQHTEDYGYFK